MMPTDLFQKPLQSAQQFLWKDKQSKVEVWLKREDQLHPQVSGNKYRKLKYNFLAAQSQGFTKVLTFGGAFSNHIAATAFAAKQLGFSSVAIVRGEELGVDVDQTLQQNKTLAFAVSCGMELHFVSRADYQEKEKSKYVKKYLAQSDSVYVIPEGGTNPLAIKGCAEIITDELADFDVICTAVGTGGTLAGLSEAAFKHQQILGFSALKGDFLQAEIAQLTHRDNWKLVSDYHFGGYAKINRELVDYMNSFFRQHHVLLDPIYTAKMLYGISDMIKQQQFKENTRILAIHTGGLQGIPGMNTVLAKKRLPLINNSL